MHSTQGIATDKASRPVKPQSKEKWKMKVLHMSKEFERREAVTRKESYLEVNRNQVLSSRASCRRDNAQAANVRMNHLTPQNELQDKSVHSSRVA